MNSKRLPLWARRNVAFAAYLDANWPLWQAWKDTNGMKNLESAFIAGWDAARKLKRPK